MYYQSLTDYLHTLFACRSKTEVEQYIESKNPKSAADVEHWLQQWAYRTHKDWFPND